MRRETPEQRKARQDKEKLSNLRSYAGLKCVSPGHWQAKILVTRYPKTYRLYDAVRTDDGQWMVRTAEDDTFQSDPVSTLDECRFMLFRLKREYAKTDKPPKQVVIFPDGEPDYADTPPTDDETVIEESAIVPVSNQPSDIITTAPDTAAFDELVTLTLRTVSSAASQRVYDQTYRAWSAWCIDNGINPVAYTPGNVFNFLTSQDTSKATRQRQLSAIRKLAQMGYILSSDDDARRIHDALRILKAPAPADVTTRKERVKHVLTEFEAYKVLRAWDGETNQEKRNRALIAVLLLTAIRRSEAAVLKWSDIDFEGGTLNIRHGKGDKQRDVPFAGDKALDALRDWQMCQPAGREYVFTRIARRGDGIGADKPISGTDIYRVVKETEQRTGIEFKPHDCRRTFATDGLNEGMPVHDMQAILGHAQASTTLLYAQKTNARQLRKKIKLSYA